MGECVGVCEYTGVGERGEVAGRKWGARVKWCEGVERGVWGGWEGGQGGFNGGAKGARDDDVGGGKYGE